MLTVFYIYMTELNIVDEMKTNNADYTMNTF